MGAPFGVSAAAGCCIVPRLSCEEECSIPYHAFGSVWCRCDATPVFAMALPKGELNMIGSIRFEIGGVAGRVRVTARR